MNSDTCHWASQSKILVDSDPVQFIQLSADANNYFDTNVEDV